MTSTLTDPELVAQETDFEPEPPSRPSRRFRLRGWLLFWGLCIVLLTGALIWLLSWQSPVPVRSVEVVGASPETEAEIMSIAQLPPDTAISAVDVYGITAAVAEIPGIAAVDFVLQRPWTVQVVVDERFPHGQVANGEEFEIIDSYGELIRVAKKPIKRLPLIAPDTDRQAAVTVVAGLGPDFAKRVKEIRQVEGEQFELTLRNGALVRLGRATDLEAKMSVLVSLLPLKASVYNVSVPDRPALEGELVLPEKNKKSEQGDTE